MHHVKIYYYFILKHVTKHENSVTQSTSGPNENEIEKQFKVCLKPKFIMKNLSKINELNQLTILHKTSILKL